MSKSEKLIADAAVEKALAMLGEHFECVQIMCSSSDSCGTDVTRAGSGNYYARQGMAHEFIQIDIAVENAMRIRQELNPE